MNAALDQFHLNIARVRNLGALRKNLDAQTTKALDTSDISRAELVMAVSALDHYIHEIVRIGMLEIYNKKRAETPSFLKFPVLLESALQGIDIEDENWLDNAIRAHHGWRSFQRADKIAEAIRLISDVKLWSEVADHIGKNSSDVTKRLNLIIDRRNKIAHEADMKPASRISPPSPYNRWDIDDNSVEDAIDFIVLIAEAIYKIMSNESSI
jgi:hypothetical protein